jgi:hypothetical protein
MSTVARCNEMCAGCTHADGWSATGWRCLVYAKPHETVWARHGKKCPLNGGLVQQGKLKLKVRVGQQKQSKKGK